MCGVLFAEKVWVAEDGVERGIFGVLFEIRFRSGSRLTRRVRLLGSRLAGPASRRERCVSRGYDTVVRRVTRLSTLVSRGSAN